MAFRTTLGTQRYVYDDLRQVLARASHRRSGDDLAGFRPKPTPSGLPPATRWPTFR